MCPKAVSSIKLPSAKCIDDTVLWNLTAEDLKEMDVGPIGHRLDAIAERREVCVETKRAYKPFRYKAKTTWASARRGLLSAVGKPNIVVGSPPEFKGEPDIWASEELLVG